MTEYKASNDPKAFAQYTAVSDNDMSSEKATTPPAEREGLSTIPPEGGIAGWLCVVGAFFGLIATFGFLNAIGVFQTTYEQTLLKDYTASDISWIFAVQLCLMWLPGPLFGRIVDTYGARPVMIPSSILCVFSLCMTSLSKKYYQIFLTQGLLYGIGAGGVFTTSFVCAGQWFQRQRGLALGITAAGSSLGGVIFPFFLDRLLGEVGFDAMVRYTALFTGILLAIACCLVTARLPRKKWNYDLGWVDFTLFKDKGFALYTIGAFLVMWGLWAPFDYLPSMAEASEVNPSMSLYLISIVNAASLPGRVIPGHIADKLGYFNVMAIVSFLTGLSILCLWLPFDTHHSLGGLIVFSLAYGFVSGAFVSLIMPCAAKSGSLETLGQRFGTFQSVIAVSCLTGLPIMGAILNKDDGSFRGLQYFAIISILLGSTFIAAARFVLGKDAPSKKI